jgi:predicted protein tyrosine phosphatase
MRLVICPLVDLDRVVADCQPDGVISLLSPDQPIPLVRSDARRLTLQFHDLAEPQEGLVAVTPDQVAELLAFGRASPPKATLLAHCWMGISRSPAAAFALACAAAPERSESAIAKALRLAAPSATPNPRLIRLADEQLGRAGRMVTAIAAIGRGADAAIGRPFELQDGFGAHGLG